METAINHDTRQRDVANALASLQIENLRPTGSQTMERSVLLIDPDTYTAGLLADTLRQFGYPNVVVAHTSGGAAVLLAQQQFAAMVFNFHFDHSALLACCVTARQSDAQLPVIVITAPGPALAEVKRWQSAHHAIDAIVEKPLRDTRLQQTLQELMLARRTTLRSERLGRLVPAEAAAADEANRGPVLIEQAILFTDLRHSTRMAVSLGPRALFDRFNAALSRQAEVVRRQGGSVIKFTGDGLLAAFHGSGKNHLATRCAQALQPLSVAAPDMPFGIGLATGLTIAGFIGEPAQRHYDVIGATVHLAARLCALAGAGEVIATNETSRHTGAGEPGRKDLGQIEVRGFDARIHCIAFAPPAAIPSN